MIRSILFFILAGVMEIGGGWLVLLWLREIRAWWIGATGALLLVVYGVMMYSPRAASPSGRL